jgi:hypothetical protein
MGRDNDFAMTTCALILWTNLPPMTATPIPLPWSRQRLTWSVDSHSKSMSIAGNVTPEKDA